MQPFGPVATASIPVPALPALGGFTFHLQGWVFASGGNAFGVVTSNGLRIVIGPDGRRRRRSIS